MIVVLNLVVIHRNQPVKKGNQAMTTDHVDQPRLTAKQERFAQNVALKGMTQSAAWGEAYNATLMSPKSINEAASRLLANVKIKARVIGLKQGATAAAVKKAGLTLADSIDEAGDMLAGAKIAGQYSAGVAAVKLRAQLSGHLADRKEVRQGPLDDADVAKLVATLAEIDAKLAAMKDAEDLVGGSEPEIAAPVRRVIN